VRVYQGHGFQQRMGMGEAFFGRGVFQGGAADKGTGAEKEERFFHRNVKDFEDDGILAQNKKRFPQIFAYLADYLIY